MRVFFLTLKNTIVLLLAVLCFVFGTAFFRLTRTSAFPFLDGTRTYYLYTSSSQAVCTQTLSFADIGKVKGESVAVVFEGEPKQFIGVFLKKINGEILYEEGAGESFSYYGRARSLGDGVWVNGEKINFHIAVRGQTIVVGTPIIFGGY